jgi:hypothetical protein
MMREVCCDESKSVEPAKIRTIQRITGSQYLNTNPFLDTAGWKQSRLVGVEFKVRSGAENGAVFSLLFSLLKRPFSGNECPPL